MKRCLYQGEKISLKKSLKEREIKEWIRKGDFKFLLRLK